VITTVVVNPASGGGRAGRMLPQVLALLRRSPGHRLVQHRTSGWVHATEVTRRATTVGEDAALVVIGGDGLTHLGLNACAGTSTRLAVVPAGTGNDLARGIGLRLKDPLASVRALLDSQLRTVDLIDTAHDDAPGQATPDGARRLIGSVVATGFDALVNLRANHMRHPRGSLRYTVATLVELPVFAPLPYRLELDGHNREVEAMLIAIGNTACYGGGMQICPEAKPDDGLLDLTILHAASRAVLIRLLPQMHSGRFVRHPVVERLQAKKVIIDGHRVNRAGAMLGPLTAMGDGEVIGPLPLTLTVRPDAVQVAVAGWPAR